MFDSSSTSEMNVIFNIFFLNEIGVRYLISYFDGKLLPLQAKVSFPDRIYRPVTLTLKS